MHFILCCFLAWTKITTAKENVTLLFGGDVSFSGPVKHFANKPNGCDYKRPFKKVQKYFQEADFSMINLESPFAYFGKKENFFLPGKSIEHCGEPRAMEGLKYLGVTAVSLANNHLGDFGVKSINLTQKLLDDADILHVGVTKGKATHLPQKPLVVSVKGVKLAFLAYCFVEEGCVRSRNLLDIGAAVYSRSVALRDIRGAIREHKVDHVIVFCHWGIEYLSMPSKRERHESILMMDFGASLIVGSHSHVREYHETHNGQLIHHGIGNLLFPSHTSTARFFLPHLHEITTAEEDYLRTASFDWDPTSYGFLLKVVLDKKKFLSYSLLNIRIKQNGPCLQPTPGKYGWMETCVSDDEFCQNLKIYFGDAVS